MKSDKLFDPRFPLGEYLALGSVTSGLVHLPFHLPFQMAVVHCDQCATPWTCDSFDLFSRNDGPAIAATDREVTKFIGPKFGTTS